MSRSPTWRYHAAKRQQFVSFDTKEGEPRTWDINALAHADYSAIEARIFAPMSMSRDRVRFTIDTYTDTATRDAFFSAFGVRLASRKGPHTTIQVVCRPSQFARFLIYRNENGGKNSFKELNPTLFTPDAEKEEIDVSGNPAA